MKLAKWFFWTLAYLVRPRPRDLDGLIRKGIRTRKPWWTFKAHLFHNADGRQWQIYLTDEQSYTRRGGIEADLHIGMDTGDIVGLTIWDGTLVPKSCAPSGALGGAPEKCP